MEVTYQYRLTYDKELVYWNADDVGYTILGRNDQYISFRIPGRSVYRNGASMYDPGKIVFAQIEDENPDTLDITITVLLISLVRG